MKRSLLSIFFSVLFSFAYSQYSVSGVVQTETQQPIANAAVILKGVNFNATTQTDRKGFYTFNNVASGHYRISIHHQGSEVQRQISVQDKNLTYNIQSKGSNSQVHEVEEVVITGLKSVKSELEKKGFAVNVIEMKDVATRNMQTVEILDKTVGVRIRQNGGLGSDISININGMTGNSVRILIDGIPASSYGDSFNLNSIPPAMIERVEVYKGVLPGYIADDALGGAINIILKKDVRNSLGLSLSYGSFNTIQADFNAAYRASNGFTANMSTFYSHSDNDYKVWGRGVYNTLPNGERVPTKERRFNDAYDAKGIIANVGFTNVSWADQLMLGYTHSEAYKEIQHGVFMQRPYKGRFSNSRADIVNLQYSKKDFLIKNLDFKVNALYSERVRKINDTVKWEYNWNGQIMTGFNGNPLTTQYGAQQGAPTLETNTIKTASTRAAASYHINSNHQFILNYLFQNIDRVDDDPIKTILERSFIGTRNMSKSNASFTYEMKAFKERLNLSVFGKYYEQTSKKTDPVVRVIDGQNTRVEVSENRKISTEGYGLAGSYLIKSGIMLMASAEKAVRLPSENEVFGDASENMIQNFNLNPEMSNNVNLGLKFGPYTISRHQISVSANGFLRDTKDKIIRYSISNNVNEASQTLPFVNYAATKSTGIDAELMYTFAKKFYLNYSISKLKTIFNREDDSYKGMQIPNEPTLTMNANLQYVFDNLFEQGGRLNVFYNFRYINAFNSFIPRTANIAGAEYFVVPAQEIHDAGVSYQFPKRFIVSFDVKNILNKQVYDNFAVQKPGRALYLKVSYNINNLNK